MTYEVYYRTNSSFRTRTTIEAENANAALAEFEKVGRGTPFFITEIANGDRLSNWWTIKEQSKYGLQ